MIHLRQLREDDRGYTIIEMVVVMLVLSLLLGSFYTFLFGGERAARDGRDWLELNQTARLVFERLTREMREAEVIDAVYPSSSGEQGAWGIKLRADFNANGTFGTSTVYSPVYDDDEIIIYRYDPSLSQLLISTKAQPTATALVDNVASFRLTYFGSDPRADVGCSPQWNPVPAGCSANDGVVIWQELDRSFLTGVTGFGNGNLTFDIGEFPQIGSIVVEMTVAIRHERHSYRSGVELRNLFR